MDNDWLFLPARREIRDGEVHAYAYGCSDRRLDSYFVSCLSQDEQARSGQFATALLQQRFVTRRGLLRFLLSQYTNIDPTEIRFSLGPYGKPILVASSLPSARITFSSSSSGDVVLIACGGNVELGADIERIDAELDWQSLAPTALTQTEQQAVAGSSPEMQRQEFYRLWCRKEAFLKGLGVGLRVDPDAVDVLGDEITVDPARAHEIQGLAKHWQLLDQHVCPGYVAAVALRTPAIISLRAWVALPVAQSLRD